MKHAPSAALILVLALAGCADQERAETPEVTYVPAAASQRQLRQTAAAPTPSLSTGSLPASASKAAVEQALRNERQIYAQGLERILLSNGMAASVLVHEDGQAGPTPALMFFGHFPASFIQRAATDGAVLERARTLGFRSVDFIDRGTDANYLFELSKTGPLPKCAAHNRLCL